MTKPLVKKPTKPKLLTLNGKGGIAAGIRSDSNRSVLYAADGFSETTYLLAEPANAEHLRQSIQQYRRAKANQSTISIEPTNE